MISIIIPAFNASKTINQALDSILLQTYPNFEVIVIDDGSTDNTKEVCREYSMKDERIKAFSQENKGPSNARNYGIEQSIGDFIYFVDSDDILPINALEDLMKPHRVGLKTDIVVGSFYKNEQLIQLPAKRLTAEQIISDLVLPNYVMGYLWNKLYIAKIIKDNKLKLDPVLFYAEDLVFNIEYLLHCKEGVYISDVVYHYDFQPDSLSTKYNPHPISKQLKSHRKAIKLLENKIMSESILRKYKNAYLRNLTGMVIHYGCKLPISEIELARREITSFKISQYSITTQLKAILTYGIIMLRMLLSLLRIAKRES